MQILKTDSPTNWTVFNAPPEVVEALYTHYARKVIAGQYGNGDDRVKALRSEGFTDSEIREIQLIVNHIMSKE